MATVVNEATARAETPGRYSAVSIALHWTIALLIVGNLTGGLLLDTFFESPDPAMKMRGFQLVQYHKWAGLTVLALSLVRLGHRLWQGFPPLPLHMKAWERVLARTTHYGFYALMIGVPLAGWAMVSASPLDFPIRPFGLFTVPKLPLPTSSALDHQLGTVHALLAYTTIALLALHIAGALKHHFINHDAVLHRMLPWARTRAS